MFVETPASFYLLRGAYGPVVSFVEFLDYGWARRHKAPIELCYLSHNKISINAIIVLINFLSVPIVLNENCSHDSRSPVITHL